MYNTLKPVLEKELEEIRSAGLFKQERIISTPQAADITANGKEVINFCANNYLGLSSHPKVVEAAHAAINSHGYGMSSVRFICGTQDIHKTLEQKLATFLGTEDTILYAAAFDANGGVFEPLLNEQDAIISDELNHASIIDGIRLCKADRHRYKHNDMADLKAKLEEAKKLFSPSATGDAVATSAMADLPRSVRGGTLCVSELREQLLRASPPYFPDLLPSNPLPKGTVIDVPDAAFRAGGRWLDLSFRCEVDADATRVVSFAFRVGAAIPRSQWQRRGFPPQ